MKQLLAPLILVLSAASAAAAPVQGAILPDKTVNVSSPVLQEVITDVLVEEGSVVKEGDIIVQLRNEREQLDVKISEKLIEVKAFIARGQEKLFKEEMGSEEKALEAKTELELTKLQLAAKKIALEEKSVRAPLSGIVVKKYKERGESVDRAEKLLEIINIDRVQVKFFLPPALRSVVKPEQKIKVKIPDLEGAEFEGRVTYVSPRNEPDSGLVQIKVLIENRDHRIKPGMQGMVDFAK